jgi:16S rRNA (guanine527-N7)-methyltransferase
LTKPQNGSETSSSLNLARDLEYTILGKIGRAQKVVDGCAGEKRQGFVEYNPLSLESGRILLSGARILGLSLEPETLEAFGRFAEELMRWNQRMNLTALREERPIVVRHFLDSLTLARFLPEGASVLDIGSGAGFPGIPLKIVLPNLEVVLLEASRKKTYFHKHVIRSLKLTGIRTVWGRSDQPDVQMSLESLFEVVVSRALSPLEVFLRDAAHYAHIGGMIIAMRGKDAEMSLRLEEFSLRLDRTVTMDVPFDGIRRKLMFFRKIPISGGV